MLNLLLIHLVSLSFAIVAFIYLFFSRKGSVIANFSIFYIKVTQSEVLLLQDYITTTGKLNNLSSVLQTVKPLQG